MQPPSDDLESPRQAAFREPSGYRRGGLTREIERVRERDPAVEGHRPSSDLGDRVHADREGRTRDRRRQQKIVLLEERAGVLPPGEAIEPRLDVLGRRLAQELLDQGQQAWIDLAPPIEIRREPEREATTEHLLPRRLRRRPARLHVLDAAPELTEGFRGVSTDRPDFRVDGLVPAEVVRVPHAKPLDRAAQ